MSSNTSRSWTGKSVLVIGNGEGFREFSESLTKSGTPNNAAEQNGKTGEETVEIGSYDLLVKAFQRTRKREGNVDKVVLWLPGGLTGPLVKADKALPPPLPALVAYVTKLASFEFRWDERPGGAHGPDGTGRGELALVLPLPVTRDTILDPVDAAAASSILGITRSTAAQASLDGFKMWMLCPGEPKDAQEKVDVSGLIDAFYGVLTKQHGRPLPSGEENAPVYVSKNGDLTLVDRPDNELNKAEAYKRLGERGTFPMELGNKIRDAIIAFTLMAEKLNLEPKKLAVYLFQAALVFYTYLWWKGWVGIPKILWFVVGAGATKAAITIRARESKDSLSRNGKRPTAVFLGSGGHTSEALQLLSALDHDVYTPRTYIVSSGDSMSVEKAVAFEKTLSTGGGHGVYSFIELPRARRVGQSYISSVWTTLISFTTAFRLLAIEPLRGDHTQRWDLLLVNGPGTCVVATIAVMLPRASALAVFTRPLQSLTSNILQILALHSPRIIYVESWARVKSLSLSGKILKRLVDKFVIQWDEVDRPANTWTSRSGEMRPDGQGRETSLGDYHGWLI